MKIIGRYPSLQLVSLSLLLLVLLLAGISWTAGWFIDRQEETPGPRAFHEGPRLQAAPARDLRRLRQREQAELSGYGWIDREAGVVHIPIDRAMQLLLARGLQQPLEEPGSGREGAQASDQPEVSRPPADSPGAAPPPARQPPQLRPEPADPPVGEQQNPSLGGPRPPPGEASP